jgi:hypothetical protein
MDPFGTAQPAIDTAVGFDCDTPLTAVQCKAFAVARFQFAARYLSRGEEVSTDLQRAEVEAIHQAGLALVPVQHVAVAPWMPSAGLGSVLGKEAAADAEFIGCPTGVVLWLDLEGVVLGAPAAEVIAFCNNWDAEVRSAGYISGVYVGASSGLSASQLYRDLRTSHYWRSLSGSAPDVDVRGFQVNQSFGGTLAGVEYDRDVVYRDRLGDLPVWWAK